jgi:hypothetical protein
MAVLDDLIISGLSYPQALAVVAEDSNGSNVDGLVQAGFSVTQAQAMNAYDASRTDANADVICQQGIWAGTTLVAVRAALDVTP